MTGLDASKAEEFAGRLLLEDDEYATFVEELEAGRITVDMIGFTASTWTRPSSSS